VKENFAKGARELWDRADKKASEMGHDFLGPEHIMLAFFESNNDLAVKVIEEFIGNPEKLFLKVVDFTQGKRYDQSLTESLLKRAQREANLSFSSYIDVSHIMTAAFDEGEEKNIPKKVLTSFGVDLGWFIKMIKYPRNIKKDVSQKSAISEAFYSQNSDGAGWSAPSLLDKYGRDLTSLAQNQSLDPVALRDSEIEDIVEVLCRRVKSNPLLIGEPGVGKSALMVGLAQRIVNKNVPQKLKDIRVFELNLTSVIAGASLQGEFEKRMSNIINYLKQEKNIILFIDEIHSIIGTGGVPGLADAANILKSPLINGDIRCIGATTMREYRKYIERDPALARRFQVIEIREPSAEETIDIIRTIKSLYEEFHQVKIPDEIIKKTVELSVLHIKDQYLPDKAIDIIDQSCAHLSLSGKSCEESTLSINDVASVISHKTKIPVEKIKSDKLEKLLHLEKHLKKKIIGQDHAISKVSDIIRLTKSSLALKPVRPDGVFLFIGPTGVGKTEMARVLAEILFDDEEKMIRLDMSEYMEPHSVSKIIGSPPGYVGSDQEGGLTGKVRTDPYSIILLDEVEKAHPDVVNIFLQVFEDGRLTDSHGRTVYFSNSTIIMTSNLGASDAFSKRKNIGFNENGVFDNKESEKIFTESLKKYFSPEFINRIDEIVYFKTLDKQAIRDIAGMKLNEIKRRFAFDGRNIDISDEVLDLISEKGYNPEYGARFLNRTIENVVLKPLSRNILSDPENKNYTIYADGEEVLISGRSGYSA